MLNDNYKVLFGFFKIHGILASIVHLNMKKKSQDCIEYFQP